MMTKKGAVKKWSSFSAMAVMAMSMAACTHTEERAVRYGAGGAAIGAIAGGAMTGTPQGAVTGAAIGAATGAITSSVVGENRQVRHREVCVYRDAKNRRFTAPCRV